MSSTMNSMRAYAADRCRRIEVLKRGDAVYVAPNVMHRGLNVSRTQAAKIFVVRVKPKDKPLTTEVQP
jgi:uncharacterized RmlC-like cupin family protein